MRFSLNKGDLVVGTKVSEFTEIASLIKEADKTLIF